jgi:hypothetical protein
MRQREVHCVGLSYKVLRVCTNGNFADVSQTVSLLLDFHVSTHAPTRPPTLFMDPANVKKYREYVAFGVSVAVENIV